MESWRKVWREGIAPQLSTKALEELRYGLEKDSDFLLQGACSKPPMLECNYDKECEGGCAMVYGAWMAGEVKTVGQADEYFHNIVASQLMSDGCDNCVRDFLNWFDDTPRDEMRREMIREVDNELIIRNHKVKEKQKEKVYAFLDSAYSD